jgi:predicted RNase H-like nuclease (RuvC/YqgF family)
LVQWGGRTYDDTLDAENAEYEAKIKALEEQVEQVRAEYEQKIAEMTENLHLYHRLTPFRLQREL